MASLAEHLSGPTIEATSAAPLAMTANLAPIGFLFVGLTLFAFSCTVVAYCRVAPPRR